MAYAKLIAAVIGMGVLMVKQFTGVDLGSDAASKLTDVVIMVLTAIGVWRVENK